VDPEQLRRLQGQFDMARELQKRYAEDPEHFKWLQEQARRAKEMQEYYTPMAENVRRNPGLQSAIIAAAKNESQGNTVRLAQEAIASANRVLNTPSFRVQAENLKRLNEIIEGRFGTERVATLEDVASRLRSPEIFRPSVDRIAEGQAEQVLREAADLASSEAIRETIERVDSEMILSSAGSVTSLDDTEVQQDGSTGTQIVDSGLSEEELDAIWLEAHQIARILAVAIFAALAISAPAVSPEQIAEALGAIIALLDFVREERATRQARSKDQ